MLQRVARKLSLHKLLPMVLALAILGSGSVFVPAAQAQENDCTTVTIEINEGQEVPNLGEGGFTFNDVYYYLDTSLCAASIGYCCIGGQLRTGSTPGECNAAGGRPLSNADYQNGVPTNAACAGTTTRIPDGFCLPNNGPSHSYVCTSGKSFADTSCFAEDNPYSTTMTGRRCGEEDICGQRTPEACAADNLCVLIGQDCQPRAQTNCRQYDGNQTQCNASAGCEWEGGYCQAEGEGPTLGNPGACIGANGQPTDAVCHYCPGRIDASGGCQLNSEEKDVNGGQVPNASSMGDRVDFCGIVQCDCKGTGAGSGYAIPLVFTSQVFTSQCNGTGGPSVPTTNYACVNGTCTATTEPGYPTMTQCQENCSTPTPLPPGATPTPTPPVVVDYACNSGCSTDAQCKTEDSRFICANTDQGKRCRLASNVDSRQCRRAEGPQCLSITMNSVTNPEAPANSQPEIGDAVRFTCGQVADAERYIFQIYGPEGTAIDLEATGNVSEPYTLLTNGPFSAQCQICTGQDDSTCLSFEEP